MALDYESIALRIAQRICDGEIQDGMGYFVAVFKMDHEEWKDGKRGSWVGHATNAGKKSLCDALRDLADQFEVKDE